MEWNKKPTDEEIQKTKENLESRGFKVIVTETKEEALEKVKETIPEQAEVYDGSSTTLEEIGFKQYLNSDKHKWKNMHKEILKEDDEEKRAELRRKYITSEYYLGSVNAISKEGELVACDASGSRVGAYLFAAKNLVLVSGINKITENLDEAIKRVREHAFPLEDERAQEAYGFNSVTAKWVIMEREIFPGRVTLILVKEQLGF